MNKKIIIVCTLVFSILFTVPVFAGSWQKNAGGWSYILNGNTKIKGEWFRDIDGRWYHFSQNGIMQTGWFQDIDGKNYYLNISGEMLTGWQKIQSKYYYFDATKGGAMIVSSKTPDGYWVDSNGAWIEEVTKNRENDNRNHNVAGEINEVEEVLEIVNKERGKAGLSPLKLDTTLQKAAQIRAEELIEFFSHTRPDGRDCFSAVNEIDNGFTALGENIAKGQTDPVNVMNGWMNSQGHRANILNGGYTHLGVGLYIYNGEKHWVQMFGKR